MNSKKFNLISDEMSEKIIEAAERLLTSYGTENITVRRILTELGITNRVFYNRFHNINEVLEIVYRSTILKIRESLPENFEANTKEAFFEYVMDIVVHSLKSSYDHKMQFNQYVFNRDSISESNSRWWCGEIKKLIDYAMDRGYIKKVDSKVLSYSIWCFIRGYNADAVGRNLPKDEAVENFKYSFGFLLDGLKS
ncbi:MAG: TetR/AcrR family transcriptional regulator [Clostridia bacterium]|nr:TetR/AcrR family transcriptional regulator [Clostridia bacterium]